MDEKTKQQFILLFNQGFEVIVLPEIESLRKDVNLIRARLDSIEGRLDIFTDKLDEHEARITTLEPNNSTL